MFNFMKEFFSKDEKRVSALIFFATILTSVAVYLFIKNTDISNNLKELLVWIYGFIAGGSAVINIKETLTPTNKEE